jgi:hypothetical protein
MPLDLNSASSSWPVNAPLPSFTFPSLVDDETRVLWKTTNEILERIADGLEALTEALPAAMENLEDDDG